MISRAIALAVCGAALSACTGIPSMPSFNMPSLSVPSFSNIPGFNSSGTPVRVESIPAGAEASIGSGPYNVTVSLAGYQPRTIPVRIATARESWDSADAGQGSAAATTIDPDPVVAELTPAPGRGEPAARKKPP